MVAASRFQESVTTTFRSMHVRNYRLYFYGQVISIAGTWMQQVAQALFVIELADTNKGTAAGTVVALQFLPTLLFGAMAGVFIDRFDKRKLLMLTQGILGVNAIVLAVLTLSGVIELWMIYAFVLANGIVTAADIPLRQSFVSEMVSEEDLSNAVALNSATFNIARIIGPALATGVLAAAHDSYGICFLVNGVSYAAVIICMGLQRVHELNSTERAIRAKGQVREGMRYVWSLPQVRAVVILVGVFGTVALNFGVTLPLIAKLDLHHDKAYGPMTMAMGVGSLIGALWTASRKLPSPKLLVGACIGFGVSSIVVALSPTLNTMLVPLAFMGMGSIAFLSTANAFVQLSVAANVRGRVMALYSMVLLGGTPLGATIVGRLADVIDPRKTMIITGVATIAACIVLGPAVRNSQFVEDAVEEDDEAVLHEPAVT